MANNRNIRIEIEIQGKEAVNEFERISQKVDSLKGKTNELKDANKEYSNTMKVLKAELALLTKGTEEYTNKKADIDKLKTSMKQNGEAIKQLRLEQAQANQELEDTRKQLNLNDMTFKQLKQTVSALAKEVEDLIPGTDKFIQKSEELKKVNERYKQVRQEIQGYQKEIAKTNQANPFNLSVDVVALADKAIDKTKELASAVDDTARQMIALRKEVQLLTGATGENLDKLSIQVKAISTTFDQDFNEVIRSGNALSKEFGVGFQESFKIIETSLLNVSAVQRGEILEQMKEYSVQAKAAGLTIDQFAGVLVKSSSLGVFSDKGIDVVKEFGLRIREQTTATRDALANAFGVNFTDKLFKDLNTGAITTTQALETIAKKLDNTSISASKTQTVIADVFGGPGEDAGLNYIKSLQNITGGLQAVTKDTQNLTKEQQASLEQNKKLATEQNNLAKEYKDFAQGVDTATKQVQIFTLQGVTNAIRAIKDLTVFLYENRLALLAMTVAVIAYNAQLIYSKALTLAWGAVTGVVNFAKNAWIGLNLVMRANPIGFIIGLIATLVSGVTVAYNSFDTFRATVQGVWNVLSNLGTIIKSAMQDLANFDVSFSKTGKSIAKSFNEGYDGEMKRTNDARKVEKTKANEEEKKLAEQQKKEKQEEAKRQREAEKQRITELTQEQLEKQKEAAEKLREAQKKYDEANLQNRRKLEDLRLELVDDSLERERQKIALDASRKKEDIEKQIQELQGLEKVGVKIDPQAIPNLNKQIELVQAEAQKKTAQVELKQTIRTVEIQESQAKRTLVETTSGASDNEKIEARKVFNRTMLALQMERIDAELKTLDTANQEDLAKINNLNAQKLELIDKQKSDELASNLTAIEEKYALLQEAEEIKFLENNASYEEQRKQILEENFDNFIQSEMDKNKALYELQKKSLEEQLLLLEQAGQGKSAQALKLQKELVKNEQAYQKESLDNEKRTADMKRKVQEGYFKASSDFVQLGIDLLGIDEEARKSNADAIKAFTVGKILVDLGAEVAGYFATPASTASLGVIGAIQLGIATARSAISIGKVMSQKFAYGGVLGTPLSLALDTYNGVRTTAKSYGTGGMVRNAGVLSGSSHAQGGLSVYDNRTGQQVAEFEGGEPAMVLSTATYKNNKTLVDSLLYTSLYKNGAPIQSMATGGMISAGIAPQNFATPSPTQATADMSDVVNEIRELREQVAQQQTFIRAYILYQDIANADEEMASLVKKNSL